MVNYTAITRKKVFTAIKCLYAETESIGVVFRTPNGLRRSLGEGKHH